MAEEKKHLRLNWTCENENQIRKATGKSAEAIELSVEELEQRIAPRTLDVF